MVAAADRRRHPRNRGALPRRDRRRRIEVQLIKQKRSARREADMANIAFIGLGNMGGPMAANLVKAGHKVVAFDLVETSKNQAKSDGATIADSAAAAVK